MCCLSTFPCNVSKAFSKHFEAQRMVLCVGLVAFCYTKCVYYILPVTACQPFCRHRGCSFLTRAETTKSGDVKRVVGLCGLFREGVG